LYFVIRVRIWKHQFEFQVMETLKYDGQVSVTFLTIWLIIYVRTHYKLFLIFLHYLFQYFPLDIFMFSFTFLYLLIYIFYLFFFTIFLSFLYLIFIT